MQIFYNGAHWRVVKVLSDVRMYTFVRRNFTAIKLQKFLKRRFNTDEKKFGVSTFY